MKNPGDKNISEQPKGKIKKGVRVVDGKAREVKMIGTKITEVFNKGKGVWQQYDEFKSDPMKDVIKEEKKIDLSTDIPLISEDEMEIEKQLENIKECPECKSANIEPVLFTSKGTRYKCKNCNETFVSNLKNTEIKLEPSKEEITISKEPIVPNIPKIEIPDVTKKVEISDVSIPNDTPETEITEIPNEIPKIEISEDKKDIVLPSTPKEIPSIPKEIITPKIEIPKKMVPKLATSKEVPVPIPGLIIPIADRLNKIIEEKNKTEIDKTDLDKSQSNINKNNKIEDKNKEVINMAEEMEEYKREQWAKKRDFEKNIENMARLAGENKNQIDEISTTVSGVQTELKEVDTKLGSIQEDIDQRIGDIKKPVSESLGEICTGVDCIKTDIKKSQSIQEELEKRMESRFQELNDRIGKLEEPMFTCDGCGENKIRALDSFCPNCGTPISEWNDESGLPVKGWIPYWKRIPNPPQLA